MLIISIWICVNLKYEDIRVEYYPFRGIKFHVHENTSRQANLATSLFSKIRFDEVIAWEYFY